MRISAFIALFMSFAFLVQAQDNSEKTLVKTLMPEESSEVVFETKNATIGAEPWDQKGMRVEIEVISNMPVSVLEQLVKAGRYELEGRTEDGIFYVNAPKMEKQVTVRGKLLEEVINFNVKTPGYYVLSENRLMPDAGLAARGNMKRNIETVIVIKPVLKTTLKSDAQIELKTGDIKIGDEIIEIE
ncbi:hypothetical protein [Saprospira grandis]|uniref:hypothetical protein n=1 Tax=Saprospira grandis TaxID=1008 RepID=UPI0022DE8328|nr:hypothetical protein [Saprospira grandis]WBM75902.1 hypothetical protein OP864_06610 [Saprospira grandis]